MNRSVPSLLLILAALVFPVLLPGCSARDEARKDISTSLDNINRQLDAIKPKTEAPSALIEESTPWFGNTTIAAQSGQFLPAAMETDNALVLTFEQPLTLEQVAGRIQAATNLRVMVDRAAPPGDSQTTGTGGTAAGGMDSGEAKFLPADGMEVTGGRMVWQGKLSNLMDQIANRFDAEWKFSGNTIRISQQIVRTFMLNALAGSTDVGGSVKTGSTGAEGGLPQQSVDSTSKLAVWEEIQKTIDSIISGKARASYSPTTGAITIAGYPSAVNAAEDYLKLQNKLRLRRVAIEAKVLSVQLSKDYDNNFDLDVVVKDAFNNQPFVFTNSVAQGADTGRSISAGVLRELPNNLGTKNTTQLVINALSAVARRVSVEYSGSLVTLSDQPAPLQVATKRSYVARVSGSSSDTTSSTTLEPGTLDIGLSMNLLPRVIEQDRIMLRIALGITDLVQLREFTSGTSTLQLPEVDSTGFLQNAVLQSGETLVLAGFERKNASNTQTGLGSPKFWGLGGGESYAQGREIRVLLITANLLPEEPVSVVRP
ncbi:MAG: hypothetical protein JWM96_1111 [Alphaproteobacteria bacterium]|nr:hypothetical protein [Alphaproteobacteria bacterium]